MRDDKVCRSLQVVSELYEHNFHDLTFYTSNCIFAFKICTISARLTKLWSKVITFRPVCTLQSNRSKSVFMQEKMWVAQCAPPSPRCIDTVNTNVINSYRNFLVSCYSKCFQLLQNISSNSHRSFMLRLMI